MIKKWSPTNQDKLRSKLDNYLKYLEKSSSLGNDKDYLEENNEISENDEKGVVEDSFNKKMFDMLESLRLSGRFRHSQYPEYREQQWKRAFSMSNGDGVDKLLKGKRVNKNMFSSGLQGVWGVPGRR